MVADSGIAAVDNAINRLYDRSLHQHGKQAWAGANIWAARRSMGGERGKQLHERRVAWAVSSNERSKHCGERVA